MNRNFFLNLLLVLTIGFSACNKENNPIDENPYATLSQSEIVSLLDESWLKSLNAPEVRRIDTVRNVTSDNEGLIIYRNDVRSLEINRNQKKSLEIFKSNDDSIRLFFYIENLTKFSYISEPDMSEPIRHRTIIDGYYWDFPHYTSATYGSNGYERFTWSVEGRVFIGVEEREGYTVIYKIELNEKEQLISVELTGDKSANAGIFTTFFYENINPIFPESFDKDDFIESEESCDTNESLATDGLWLKMGDGSVVATSDIDFYDISTHMIYLKKKIPYLKDIDHFDRDAMSVHVGNDEIYSCLFYSSYQSTVPTGAYISGPPFNKEDIIRISFMQYFNANNEPTIKDPRNDKRIIAALKSHNQYHEGLHINIQSVQISGRKVVLNLVLSNHDTFNYYYLDPDKMGFGLFHYFTNGPTFINDPYTNHFTHRETVIHPDPWDSWKTAWLTLIKSGESKDIQITYNQFDIMPAGKYKMYFEFPGLNYGISQKDLALSEGRIWMGSIGIEKDISIH